MTLHAGFEWPNWSRLGAPAIVGPTGGSVVGPRRSTTRTDTSTRSARLQGERALDRCAPVSPTSNRRSIRRSARPACPDNDRFWASVGATYQWNEKLSFDIAYTHIFSEGYRRPASCPGHQDFAGLPFVADVDSSVNIVSAAVRYRWDDPAKADPGADRSQELRHPALADERPAIRRPFALSGQGSRAFVRRVEHRIDLKRRDAGSGSDAHRSRSRWRKSVSLPCVPRAF